MHDQAQQSTQPQESPAFDTLEGLLEESKQHAAAIFSLDDLLSESVALVEASSAEKELKKRVARGGMQAGELVESQSLLLKWELARVWGKTKNVLAFTRQRCQDCGSYHNTFSGFFELHQHKNQPNTTRQIAVTRFEMDLPKLVTYSDAEVPTCHACAEHDGWELEDDSPDSEGGLRFTNVEGREDEDTEVETETAAAEEESFDDDDRALALLAAMEALEARGEL